MSVSAEVPLAPDPKGLPESSASDGGDGGKPRQQPARPLVVTGGIAALAAAASGLAVLVTLTAIGWITAPHVGIGTGLGGVLRTAAMLWLVGHHVGFTVISATPTAPVSLCKRSNTNGATSSTMSLHRTGRS